ncbi:MAG: PEGA domain-containing protein [Deltaproteobacteria bacterium]|nr:PEGA domain-containing protein [Deltaproteobacteria bacterium]
MPQRRRQGCSMSQVRCSLSDQHSPGGCVVSILACLGLLLGAPPPARAQQETPGAGLVVAALGLELGEGIAPAAGVELMHKIEEGLRQGLGSVSLLEQRSVRQLLQERAPELAGCREAACLTQVARQLQAWTLVLAKCQAELGTYTSILSVLDGANGATLLQKSSICEICTLDEALATLQQTASELGAELAQKAAATQPAPEPARTRVTVISHPPGARLYLNRQEVGITPVELQLLPGEHLFAVRRAGFLPSERLLSVRGTPISLEFRLKPETGAVAPPPMAASSPPLPPAAAQPQPQPLPQVQARPQQPLATSSPPATPAEGQVVLGYRTLAYMGLGLGLAGTGVGAVLLGLDGEPTCDGPLKECPSLWDTEALGITMTALGGGLLAGSAVLFLFDQSSSAREAAAPGGSPAAAGGQASTGTKGSFQLIPLVKRGDVGFLLLGGLRF